MIADRPSVHPCSSEQAVCDLANEKFLRSMGEELDDEDDVIDVESK